MNSYYSGSTPSYASLVATDASGNVYVAGTMDGTSDFDNGPGTYNVTVSGPGTFVAKYTSAGALVWAKGFTGFWNAPDAIAVGADGSVYTTGAFGGTTDFDPGSGVANLSPHTYQDAFVSKLDSAGNFVWAKALGGTSGAEGFGIAVASDGSVYTTGQFDGTVDFDPGSAKYNLTAPAGQEEAYVSKLTSAGSFVWANAFAASSSTTSTGIAVGADGSVYTTGDFSDTADFDPGSGTFNLTSAGAEDAYVSKLTSAGAFVWAKQFGGSGYDDAYGIAVASDGSIYAAGRFEDGCNFDPGATNLTLPSAGAGDIFVAKLTSAGGFVWAKGIGGSGDDWGQGVAVGPNGNVYLTGEFQGTVDFDPGTGVANLTSAGSEGSFVARLDSAGNFLWAGATGSPATDPYGRIDNLSQSLAVAYDGAVYTIGQFEGTGDFDPGTGTFNLTGTLASGNNGFLAKVSSPIAPIVTLAAPAWTNVSKPSVTMTATETSPGIANGTTAYLDVDLNNDGDFTDAGETGYLTATVTNGTATFTPTASLPDGTYHLRARVSDVAGTVGASAVSTMVVATAPPTVTLTPARGDGSGAPDQRAGGPFWRVRHRQLLGHDHLGRRHDADDRHHYGRFLRLYRPARPDRFGPGFRRLRLAHLRRRAQQRDVQRAGDRRHDDH